MKTAITYLLFVLLSQSVLAEESLWSKSYLLESEGKYQQAAAVLEPVLSESGIGEYGWLRTGWLHYLQANYNDSRKAYLKALDLNNQSIDARLGIILPLLAKQRYREVEYYANQIISIDPWNLKANVYLMLVEEVNKEWSTLAQHAQRVSQRYPTDADSLVYLARAYAWLGESDLAKRVYQRVQMIYPTNIEASYYINNN